MLELLHLIELVHWIAWAIKHPREARARFATVIRGVVVFVVAMFAFAVVASVAIDALRLPETAENNASVVATVVSIGVGAAAVYWYLRRRRRAGREAEPADLSPRSAHAEN